MMCPPQYYLRSFFIAPFKIYYCLPAALNETATQLAEIKDTTIGENAVKGKRIADFTSNNLAAGDLKKFSTKPWEPGVDG